MGANQKCLISFPDIIPTQAETTGYTAKKQEQGYQHSGISFNCINSN